MTMKSTDSEFDISEFFEKHQKTITYVGGGIAAVAVGIWLWVGSANRQALRAEQMFVTAERSAYSGNAKLAEEDLKRVVDRYGSTAAGVRASILLAQQYFKGTRYPEGISALRAALSQGASKPFRPAINGLLGGAYEGITKFDSAATAYAAAAAEALTQAEREAYQANQARALMSGGKKADALKVWQAIAARETSPLLNEAKLRIAELSVEPAKGG